VTEEETDPRGADDPLVPTATPVSTDPVPTDTQICSQFLTQLPRLPQCTTFALRHIDRPETRDEPTAATTAPNTS
jgi:hypothetical protein